MEPLNMQPPTRVNLTMDAVRLYNDVAAECAKRTTLSLIHI